MTGKRKWLLFAGLVAVAAGSTYYVAGVHASHGYSRFAIYCGSSTCNPASAGNDQGVVAGRVNNNGSVPNEGTYNSCPGYAGSGDPGSGADCCPPNGASSHSWGATSDMVATMLLDVNPTDGKGFDVTRFETVAYAGDVNPGTLWHSVTDQGGCQDDDGNYWRYYDAVLAN